MGSNGEGLEAIREALVCRDGALRDVADSVHPGSVEYKHAVPVDREALRH